jgi:hypothetical protein
MTNVRARPTLTGRLTRESAEPQRMCELLELRHTASVMSASLGSLWPSGLARPALIALFPTGKAREGKKRRT